MMNQNTYTYRVRYHDTDHFGVMYYANYLNLFEAGRTEILRDNKISYAQLEKDGFFAPVKEVKVIYHKPAKYDDVLVLETTIEHIGNSSIKFAYKVLNQKTKELLIEGYTINIFVTKELKPVRVPDNIRKIIK